MPGVDLGKRSLATTEAPPAASRNWLPATLSTRFAACFERRFSTGLQTSLSRTPIIFPRNRRCVFQQESAPASGTGLQGHVHGSAACLLAAFSTAFAPGSSSVFVRLGVRLGCVGVWGLFRGPVVRRLCGPPHKNRRAPKASKCRRFKRIRKVALGPRSQSLWVRPLCQFAKCSGGWLHFRTCIQRCRLSSTSLYHPRFRNAPRSPFCVSF
mmetsp:Transcript_1894/g.5669  ORF Transcript_1894/g.5669 Transcript_1894/m.5669 type:complete len:211 (-) Transcript_1894:60-692(-)